MRTCTALNLRDDLPCSDPATSSNGLFCDIHARQVHGLYTGYKRRNAELDNLDRHPPKSLPTNYLKNDWQKVDDAKVLAKVHDYLGRRYNLLNRVVEARNFHHSHFYKDTSDFGHESFLDRLRSARSSVALVLARLERRVLHLDYAAEQWYQWITAEQKASDVASQQERNKVKQEAALFKQHQATIAALRNKEEEKLREAAEKEEVWDPIESVIALQRQGYVAMIKFLICSDDMTEEERKVAIETMKQMNQAAGGDLNVLKGERAFQVASKIKRKKEGWETKYFHEIQEEQALAAAEKEAAENRKAARIKRKKDRREQRKAEGKVDGEDGGETNGDNGKQIEKPEGSLSTETEVAQEPSHVAEEAVPEILRLKNATNKLREVTAVNSGRSGESDNSIFYTEIQEYRLLRNILASPSLLVAALTSASLEAFLNDDNRVRNSDLRDLALRLASPTMEAIRNACADWANAKSRTNDPEEESDAIVKKQDPTDELVKILTETTVDAVAKPKKPEGDRKGRYRARGDRKKEIPEAKTERVKLCGKYIHNYDVNTRMPRRGWTQFVQMSQCSIWTAIDLCKSWNEFYELSVLAMNGYFHGLTRDDWRGPNEDVMQQHWRRIGFVAWARSKNAEEVNEVVQTSRRAPGGRTHQATEARNYFTANTSREDPRARAFIKMASTYTNHIVIWARDRLTGEVLNDPPSDEKWLCRDMHGNGRAGRGKWQNRASFDTKWLAQMEKNRTWKFSGFKDYLEIVIWNRHPFMPYKHFEDTVTRLLHKAYRICYPAQVVNNTLDVYERIAVEDDGEGSPRATAIREVREVLQDYGRKRLQQYSKQEARTSEFDDYYNWVDEELDRLYMPYASEEDVLRNVIQMTVRGEKPPPELDGETRLIEVDGNDDEDWESVDSDKDEGPIWKQAEFEDADLHEEVFELGEAYWEDVCEMFPERAALYKQQRNLTNSRNSHNTKDLKNKKLRNKLLAKEDQLMSTATLVPRNWAIQELFITTLWGEDVPSSEISMPPGFTEVYAIEDIDDYKILRNKEARARNIPVHRPARISQAVWDDWDRYCERHDGNLKKAWANLPQTWVREIMAGLLKLWREGMIEPAWELEAFPIIASEASGHLHWYVDYRPVGDQRPDLPPPPPPTYLRDELRKYHEEHGSKARYSLVRIKSSPDYWPSKIEPACAEMYTMLDPTSRVWKWTTNFPKDTYGFEKFVHFALKDMLLDQNTHLGSGPRRADDEGELVKHHVRIGVDTFLVMGKDSSEAKYWTQWCLSMSRKLRYEFEADFAKSFLNCTFEFLDGLDQYWYD